MTTGVSVRGALIVGTLAAFLLLSGCAGGGTESGASVTTSTSPAADDNTDGSVGTPGYAARTRSGTGRTETARLPDVSRTKVPTLADLIGRDADGLKDALGKATLVRRDLDTEIWQYRTADCVLFAFLYPKDGAHRVRHVEARAASGNGSVDLDRCLRAVAVN